MFYGNIKLYEQTTHYISRRGRGAIKERFFTAHPDPRRGSRYGPYESFYKDGQVHEKFTYNGYKKTGLYQRYYPDGRLALKCIYRNKPIWQQEELEGPYESYYENGQPKVKCNYKDAKLNGLYKEYYETGKLKKRCLFKNGQCDGPYEEYDEQSQRIKQGAYVQGEFIPHPSMSSDRLDITLLKEEQIWGDNALDVIKKYGTKTSYTDLVVVLGGFVDYEPDQRTVEGDLTGAVWTASVTDTGDPKTIDFSGKDGVFEAQKRFSGIRPVLPPHVTKKITPDNIKTKELKNGQTVDIVEYGAYPQTIATLAANAKLEKDFNNGKLKPTTLPPFTFDRQDNVEENRTFSPQTYPVYEKDKKLYIRVEAKRDNGRLSERGYIGYGKPYWLRITPLEWLKDKSGNWIAKKTLVSDIPYSTKKDWICNFETSELKEYLQIFAKEMMGCVARLKEIEKQKTLSASAMGKELKRIKEQRKKLAKKLLEIRREYGNKAKQYAQDNKIVQTLRKEVQNKSR